MPSGRHAGIRRTATAAVAALMASAMPAAADRNPPRIALDVGHSLAKPGATSARGVPEFAFNRQLAMAVEAALAGSGWQTRLIGAEGEAVDLHDRSRTAAGADFLLSLHHDSVQPRYLETWQVDGQWRPYSDRFAGFSLFVSRANADPAASLACARAIGAALRAAGFTPSLHHGEPIAGENRPLLDADNAVHAYDGLVVLRTAAMPAVLLEAGIIVNRDEEVMLSRPETRSAIAGAIAAGLGRCLSRG
jgi:N-acetylmuramoyl-L-alanine amidase